MIAFAEDAMSKHTAQAAVGSSMPVPLRVFRKRFYPAEPHRVIQMLSEKSAFGSDGLIFTPLVDYTMGPSKLLYKYQPLDLIRCDIMREGVVHECKWVPEMIQSDFQHWLTGRKTTHSGWVSVRERIDKLHANSDRVKSSIESFCNQPLTPEHFAAVAAQWAAKIQMIQYPYVAESDDTRKVLCNRVGFESLYKTALEEVEKGTVLRSVDSETGLEIFSYCVNSSSININRCRGLVLHPPSRSG